MRSNNDAFNNISLSNINIQQVDPVVKMKTEISEGHNHITQQFANLDISIDDIDATVLLIGSTQVGKSTLVNYLAYNPLIVRWGDLGLFLEHSEIINGRQNNLRVGQGINATTTKPNCWYDPTTRTLFWDCPGFEDTREFPQDVINTFYVNKLFISSKNVKTILVLSENSFRNGAIPFRAVLNRLSSMFEEERLI
jgi:predicted GTPase